MSKIRKGNYIFVTQIGDHDPRHVHIYQRGRMVLKYDLTSGKVMKGVLDSRLQRLIDELTEEGRL